MSTFVIFDIDGTLLYSNKVDSQCFADTYESIYRKKFPSIDWQKYPHVTDTTIFNTVIQEQFNRQVDPNEVELFTDEYIHRLQVLRQERPREFQEVPSAKTMVDFLIDTEEYEVGIATGGWERPARIKLAHVDIITESLFMSFADNKVTREEILQESIDLAEEATGPFDRIVYVGDAIWDVQTTRNMNLPFIGIRRTGDHEVLRSVGAETILQDYRNHEAFLNAIVEAPIPSSKTLR